VNKRPGHYSPITIHKTMNNQLTNYTLYLADSNLILAQRNSEWCGHGPILEQDIAITNISLDLLGQARNFYQYAASLLNEDQSPLSARRGEGGEAKRIATEDSLAYLRTEREFKNLLLAEQPNGDWAQTILRQYFYSEYQFLLYSELQHGSNEQIAAIAAKALKETTYHVKWSSEWVVRLGDGTEESNSRMLNALNALWCYTGELFEPADYEKTFLENEVALKNNWLEKVTGVLAEAQLPVPQSVFMQTGGKTGTHTEHLGFILTELQYMQRAYPNSEW
jgi:ring-1,2-phenylacetyl-CoA epoxidase subunit PaaC